MIADFKKPIEEAPSVLELPEDQLLPNQRADLEAHRAALARVDMMPSSNTFQSHSRYIGEPLQPPVVRARNSLQDRAREKKAREIARTPWEDPYDPDTWEERMLARFGKTR